ncbi:hypothetical protein BX666DRAFT_1413756 [Dichotomocladium elegans]|nr:hypothetical protein BX666DRAFT_1413756 [Dichotomocladium elegans]
MPQSRAGRDEESQPLLQNEEFAEPNRLWRFLTWFWRFCIFGLTGSSSVAVTRFIIHVLGADTLGTGIYYLVFFILEMIIYTIMLVFIGTCLGQRKFFCAVATKIWGWLIPSNWIIS